MSEGSPHPLTAGVLLERPGRDRDAGIAAAVAMIFLHLLVFLAIPRAVPMPAAVEIPEVENLSLTLLDALEEPEIDFVRANPDGMDGVPDDLRNISDRDQIAAQEEVTPLGPDNAPAIEGDEADSNRLVQGDPFREPPSPSAATSSQAEEATSPMVERLPAPAETAPEVHIDLLEAPPEGPEGIAAVEEQADNLTPTENPEAFTRENPSAVSSPLDGPGDAQSYTPPQEASNPSQQAPRPDRPRVALDNSHGPLRHSVVGVSTIGRVSWNARYSEFGEYWKRVAEIIERRWNQLVYNSLRSINFDGERVRFEFIIRRDGTVVNLRVSHAGVSRFEETLARDAIQSTAPYFEWTPDMIATMGEEAEFAIEFIY